MQLTFEAVFVDGVLRPTRPVEGLADNARVTVVLTESAPPRSNPLAGWVGDMPDEDAADMMRIIDAEFEQVNPDDWR